MFHFGVPPSFSSGVDVYNTLDVQSIVEFIREDAVTFTNRIRNSLLFITHFFSYNP